MADLLLIDDTNSLNEDDALTVNASGGLLSNDSPMGLSVTAVNGSPGNVNSTGFDIPSVGHLTVTDDGGYAFTPVANFNGPVNFTYTASNFEDPPATANATITVTPVNDAPVAVDDGPITTPEDTAIASIDVVGNDTDVDGDPLSVSGTPTALHGVVAVNGDGTLRYTPNADYNGPDTISYTVTDGSLTDDGAVAITVTPVNDAPVAVDDGPITTPEDTAIASIDVVGNDTDVDGDPLSVSGTPTALHGVVAVNGDGTLNYTPNADYNGPDTISYTVTDGSLTDDGAVAITVTPVNDAPVAVDDTVAGTENTPITIAEADLLGNDTDVDGDPLSITSVTSGSHGTATLNGDGSVSFTPEADFRGAADFSYIATDGTDTSNSATVTVNVAEEAPAITIDKSNGGVVDANTDGHQDAGDQIVYDYNVTNSGNVTLLNVTATDDQTGSIILTGLTDQDSDGQVDDLAVGASATGTATVTLTQDQIDAGFVANVAEASGQPPNEGPFVFGLTTNTVLFDQTTAISIDKNNGGVVDANTDGHQDAGDQIVYDYNVTNAGNVTLFNVSASDYQLGSIVLTGLTDLDGDGQADDLAAGTSATGTATVTLTQDQVDAGTLTNTATATGTAPNELGDVSGTDTNAVTIEQTPLITIDKSNGGVVDANTDGHQDAGDQIVYDYNVTNAGNVTLFNVSASDDQLGSIVLTGLTDEDGDGQIDDLAVGGSATGTGTVTLTQTQVDAGFVANVAEASAQPPNDGPFIFGLTTNTVLIDQAPAITIDKSNGGVVDANTDGHQDAGDQIVYDYNVTNTGNVTLFNVVASDDQLGAIALTGLTDVDGDGQVDDLAVGASATGTATVTLTQDQVDAGLVTNTATATGTAPNELGDVTGTDTNTVAIEQTSVITIEKSNGGVVDANTDGHQDAGDQIVYDYNVTNAGNVSLFNVTASDDLLGAITLAGLTDLDGDGQADDLAVGASATGTATATLTQPQVEAGSVTNIATATGTAPNELGDVTATDTNTVTIEHITTIDLVKTNGGIVDTNADGHKDAGDQVAYNYAVTNTGNVGLLNVAVTDTQLGLVALTGLTDLDGDGQADDLAAGASAAGTATATLTQSQVDAGFVTNGAIATAEPAGPHQFVFDLASNTILIKAGPSIDVEKTNGGVVDANTDGHQDAGDQIVYDYNVTNTGNVSLYNVTASDDLLGTITLTGLTDLDGDGQADDLAVGASATGTATATLTQTQVDAGLVTNTVTATGSAPRHGATATDTDSNTVSIEHEQQSCENKPHSCGSKDGSSGNQDGSSGHGCGDWLVACGSHDDVFGEEGKNVSHWQGQNSQPQHQDAWGSHSDAAFAMAHLEHAAALQNSCH